MGKYPPLALYKPELLGQWDFEKNEIDPYKVSPFSDKVALWICPNCHRTYSQRIRNITRGHCGCEYCNHTKPISGINDLETINPILAKEWHPVKNSSLKPSDVFPKASKKVWWQCSECGNEWKAYIYSRVDGKGCPKCKNKNHTSYQEQVLYFYLSKYFNDSVNGFREWNEDHKEIDIYIPSLKFGVEYDGANWHKDINRDIEKQELARKNNIHLLHIREYGCPEVPEGFPQIKIGKSPLNTIECDDMVRSVFEYVNTLFESNVIADVDVERDRALILEQYYVSKKKNSLALLAPEIAAEWNYDKNGGLVPENFSLHSGKEVWWKCKHNHEWSSTIANRVAGNSCRYCSNKKLLKGFNDFATRFPELLDEWDFERNNNICKPDEIMLGFKAKVWWKCKKCGNSWNSRVDHRVQGSGCPECAMVARIKTKNESRSRGLLSSLLSEYPQIAQEWDYKLNKQTPDEIGPKSNALVFWLCSKGHSYEARVADRTINGDGCPYCSGRKALPGFNDLKTLYPKVALDWNPELNEGLLPENFRPGSGKKIIWKCHVCGKEWTAPIYKVTSGRSKCLHKKKK